MFAQLFADVHLCVLQILGSFYSLSTLSVLFSFLLSFWDSDTNVVLLESHRLLKLCSYVFVLLSQLLRLVKFCSFLKLTDSLLGHLHYNIEPIQRVIFFNFLISVHVLFSSVISISFLFLTCNHFIITIFLKLRYS